MHSYSSWFLSSKCKLVTLIVFFVVVAPGGGGTQRLIKAIGKSKAMEMILTGSMIDAHQAERDGLVTRVVPNAEVGVFTVSAT